MIPLATIKAWLGIPTTTTTFDADLIAFAARVLAAIEKSLDWYFGPARDRVEIVEAVRSDRLILRQPPITTTGFVLEQRYYAGGAWTIVPTTEYEFGTPPGRTVFAVNSTGFWLGPRNYRASYEEGFTDVPGDIVQLALELIASGVLVGQGVGDVDSEHLGDYAYTRGGAINVAGAAGWPSVAGSWRRGII